MITGSYYIRKGSAFIAGLEFNILYALQSLHTPWLDQIMMRITTLGDGGGVWILAGALLLLFKRTRRMGAAVLLSLLAGYLLGNVFLKNLLVRQRPCWLDTSIPVLIEVPLDYSFPSGHSLSSFAAAMSIFLIRKSLGVPALILASLIAGSRLYLFVHFPSDVICGILLGIFVAWIVNRAFWWYDRKHAGEQGMIN